MNVNSNYIQQKRELYNCKDADRKEEHENISFDFLGYTFRPRLSKNRWGKHFVNFTPAISNKSKKSIRQKSKRLETAIKGRKRTLRPINDVQLSKTGLDQLLW